jgi:predicted PurR-regulated permease PerM
MNMNAVWTLDIIIAVGMIFAAAGAIFLARKVAAFSRSLSTVLESIQRQAGDVQSEAISLMRSTQVSERHFDRLTGQLTKLAASADTVAKSLPSAASNQHGNILPRVFSMVMSVVSAYKFFRSIFSRRKS